MKKLLSFCFTLILTIQFTNAQSDLVITEIMYNPPEAGTDSLEFIEIYNKGSIAINLNNYTCTGGNYTFPNVMLNPSSYYVIAVDMVAFNNIYGLPADGQFTNGLNNGGEDIVLKDDLGNLLDSVEYDDFNPWPSGNAVGEPDGGGASIILCDENLDNNDGNNWQASTNSVGATINGFPVLASPGTANSCTACTPTFGIDPLTACDSLTWTNGVTYYADNFTAKDTLVNAAGCDSIVTLDLAVNYSSSPTVDTRTECDSLVWIDSITYYTDNTTATHMLTNQSGCDSLVTLNLTIIGSSTTSTDVHVACDSLTWLDGNTYTTNNNTATHIVPNAVGCDSIITLDLTINNSSDVTDTIVACDSLTWIDGNTYFNSNTTAMVVDTTVFGCDSIIRLNLTINQTPTVSLLPFDPDTVCEFNGLVTIPNGSPSGGTYAGTGVSGNMFDPLVGGIGTYSILYSFSGVGGCVGKDSTNITVDACVGIENIDLLKNIHIYPNPSKGLFTIDLGGYDGIINYTITTIDRRLVKKQYNISNKNITIDLTDKSQGMYLIKIEGNDISNVYKILKN